MAPANEFNGVHDNGTFALAAGIMRGTHKGCVVKLSAAKTVALCQAEDKFFGVIETIDQDNAFGAVKETGYKTVAYSGAAPSVGSEVELVANGTGGVKSPAVAGTGLKYRVVEVNTELGVLTMRLDNPLLTATQDAAAALLSIGLAGYTGAENAEDALEEIYNVILTDEAVVPIPLSAFMQENGTPLTQQEAAVAGFAQLADKEIIIKIPAECTEGDALAFNVPLPYDLDDAADMSINILAGKSANSDALTLDCEAYFCGPDSTGNSDAYAGAAKEISQAASVLSFPILAAAVPATPAVLTGIFALGGTNDGDAVYIFGAYLQYKKKLVAVAE